MLHDPICFLVDYLGLNWIVRHLKRMHVTKTKNKLPTPESTLTMIHSHPAISAIWAIERVVIPLIQKKTKSIPLTDDFVLLLLLARDIFVLKYYLPKDYASHIKNRFFSARQELLVGAAHKIIGNQVSFKERVISSEEKSYDLNIETGEKKTVLIECKARLGRDDERKALHNILAIFAPKMIHALESNRLNYAVLIHSDVRPVSDPLLKCVPDIIESIKRGPTQLKINQGKYTVILKKLCDPGGGIKKHITEEINSKYSWSMKTGSPPQSSIIYVPRDFDIYEPYIVGISLDRLQKESRDPLKGPLSKANAQLKNKNGAFGVVFYKHNENKNSILERCVKRIQGDAASYPHIDAVVLYAQREGVTRERLQKDVRPFITIAKRVWINDNSKDIQNVKGLVGINASFEPYIKSCNFSISNKDIKILEKIYKTVGILN